MSRKFSQHYADAKGTLLEKPGVGILFAAGTTVPADATAGYAPGCLFLDTDASAGSTLWVNNGTATSSAFDAVAGSGGAFTIDDDTLLGIGTGAPSSLSWETVDANANKFILSLPTPGSVDVPVVMIGNGLSDVDTGLHNGALATVVSLWGTGATATGPVIETRKSRGTPAAPTVCTTADDILSIRGFGCVANGEWVQTAEIRFDIAGTIATTRGPGTITFMTATDAAPSVLTNALLLTAAQNAVLGGGAASQSLTFDTTGTDVVLTASSAALAMGAITLNVTGTRFVQSYHTNITSTNALTVDSSETVKRDIAPYGGDALAVLDEMDVITFQHDEWLDPTGKTKIGIRAESVHEGLALDEIDRGDKGTYPGVNMYALCALQTKAIQQLSRRLKALEGK